MLITAITPVTGSKFALLIAVAWATLFAAAGQAAVSGDFAGLIDIGRGRKMYLECRGSGSPAVVLVAGLKASAGDWNVAKPSGPTVFAAVAKFTRVCAYDRPGTPVGEKPSRSDPVPQPTAAEDAVSDLHALLSAAGVAGPYVLVGHSYGARAHHRNTWSGDSNRDGARLAEQPVIQQQQQSVQPKEDDATE
jgi:pimeloyl-ACP methyl ester carboxylesterase